MKKIILIIMLSFLFIGLYAQNEYKYPVYMHGGAKIGGADVSGSNVGRVDTLAIIDGYVYIFSLGDTIPIGTLASEKSLLSDAKRIMHVFEAEVVYTNVTQTTIITLPAEAVIWDINVEVRTAFTGTGTDLLDIGVTGTGNRYEDNLDIAVAPQFPTMSLTNVPDRMSASTNITFTYVDTNSDAGAGQAYVYVTYSLH